MRFLAFAMAFAMCASAGSHAYAENSTARKPSAALYDELVQKAQSGETNIDYTMLRLSYALTQNYDPHDFSVTDAMDKAMKASQSGDCATVLSATDTVLKADFTSLAAHFMRHQCFDKAGNREYARREAAIAGGLGSSIFKSGDGKSAKTAYVAVTGAEEIFVLAVLELDEEMQSLVQSSGHSYDVISCTNSAGLKQTVYFRVDEMLAGETKMLSPKGKQ